jgi:hypothetical protein
VDIYFPTNDQPPTHLWKKKKKTGPITHSLGTWPSAALSP